MNDINNNELYHYGVKGMKWGQRRAIKKAERDRVKKEKGEFKTDLKDYRKASKDLARAVNALAPGRENNSKESRQAAINSVAKLSYVKKSIAAKKGEEYLNQVMDKSESIERNRTLAFVGSLVGASVGLAYVSARFGLD